MFHPILNILDLKKEDKPTEGGRKEGRKSLKFLCNVKGDLSWYARGGGMLFQEGGTFREGWTHEATCQSEENSRVGRSAASRPSV